MTVVYGGIHNLVFRELFQSFRKEKFANFVGF